MESVTFAIVNFVIAMRNVCLPGLILRIKPSEERSCEAMKLMNYDCRTLIMKNVRTVPRELPTTYSKAQYQILCRLITQKHITKQFFEFLLLQLYDLSDWKQLNYNQMYELIHILTYWDYEKARI